MLKEILTSNNIVESINNNMDYLLVLIPELKSIIKFPHKNPRHHLDVWNHTLYALSFSENDFEIRLCLLLHDIGKPFSYQDEEVRHFHGHAKKSSEIARIILNRLNYNEEYIEYICYLIKNHDKKICDVFIENNYEISIKLYKIQKCDALAHHPDSLEKRKKYLSEVKNKLMLKKVNIHK